MLLVGKAGRLGGRRRGRWWWPLLLKGLVIVYPRVVDECECDPERIRLEVGSPRPPSSSPDFIGSDSSSPPDPSQHPDILLSLCGGLKGNRVSVEPQILARECRGLVCASVIFLLISASLFAMFSVSDEAACGSGSGNSDGIIRF